MNRSMWKKWERYWAEQLGGIRIPVTGRKEGDVPDVDHPYLAIEIKATSRNLSSTIVKAQKQAQLAGTATGRVPMVGWTVTGGQGGSAAQHFVIFTLEDFKELSDRLENGTTRRQMKEWLKKHPLQPASDTGIKSS